MSDIFTVKNLMNIAAWKEIAETGMNAFQFITGIDKRVRGGKKTDAEDAKDGTQKAQVEGKGNIDEHNYLIGLAEVHFGASLSAIPKEDLTVSRGHFRKLMKIHKLLREEGKSGGAEKLMHVIGHESHLQGTVSQRASNPKGQKPEGEAPAPKIDIHNVRERTNPAGRLIIRFLTDIEPQEAVDLLTAASVTDTAKDKAAATTKAVADKGKEAWEEIKKWWLDGNRDTRIHAVWARIVLGDDAVMKRILSSDRALELWNSYRLEANDPKRARAYLEDLQKYIWDEVEAHQKKDEPAEPDPEQPPVPSPSRFQWLPRKVPMALMVWIIPVIILILIVYTR